MEKVPSVPIITLKPKVKQDSYLVGFTAGATASVSAEFFTLPLDTAKVRMMLYGMKGKYRTVPSTLQTIVREQGFFSLWNGFTPNAARQALFSGTKICLYEPIRNFVWSSEDEKRNTPFLKKIFAGVTSGAAAWIISTPGDLLGTRMQDSEFKKRYSSIGDMIKKIYRAEGTRGFFRGVGVSIWRQMVMNAAELSTYDASRQYVMNNTNLPDSPYLYLFYGMAAGFVGAVVCSPLDLVKVRVMNNPEIYKSPMYCLKMTIRKEGFLFLYSGLRPFMIRAIGFNSVFFLFYGHLRQIFGNALDGKN